MTSFLKYTFPVPVYNDVCLTQSTTAAGNLNINGNLANKLNNTVNFMDSYNYCRNLSFTATTDLSALTLTITGQQNGVSIVETIAGPNNNTVYTGSAYDVVTGIYVNGIVNNISVGTGLLGYFRVILTNTITYSLQLRANGTNTVQMALYTSLEDLSANKVPYKNMIGTSTSPTSLNSVKTIGTLPNNIYNLSLATTQTLCKSILIPIQYDAPSIASNSVLTLYYLSANDFKD